MKKSQMRNWTKKEYSDIIEATHKNAIEHGWHSPSPSIRTCLMLVITEAAEAVEAYRKDGRANKQAYLDIVARPKEKPVRDFSEVEFCKNIKNTIEDELADICIRIFDIQGACGIGVSIPEGVIDDAIQFNKNLSFPEMIFELIEYLYLKDFPLQGKLSAMLVSVIAISELMEIDLPFFIETKMRYNKNRPYRHGNKKV